MKLTQRNIKKFNKTNRSILNQLNFEHGKTMRLNGSYPLSLWASDIDLYQKIDFTENMIKLLMEAVYNILKMIKKDPITEFSKLKIGDKPIRNIDDALKVLKSYTKVFNLLNKTSMKWLKLDLFLFTGEYLEDLTIIYDFSTSTNLADEDFKKLFYDEFKLYVKKKNYVKALKRLNKIENKFDDILNDSFIGFGYLTISRLKSVQDSKMNSKIKKFVLSNLKEDIFIKLAAYDERLSNGKLKYLSDIPKMINNLNKKLNDKIISLVDLSKYN